MRFNKINDNDIYVNAGTGVSNASQVVVENNGTVTQYTEYSVDINAGSYIAIVLPKENSENTAFEFQYWVAGEQMSAFAQWWNKSFKTPQGQGLLLLIIISLICCAGFCIFGARFFYIKGDETMKK
jgi:hypothetical protein